MTKIDPVIILPGINHSPTLLYDENGRAVFNGKGRQIGGTLFFTKNDRLLKKELPALLSKLEMSRITRRDMGIEKAAYALASEAFEYQRCENDGTMKYNLKTMRFGSLASMDKSRLQWAYCMVPMQGLVKETGLDSIWFYTFNLVGDPIESTKELDKYIDMVMEKTGAGKVTLMPVSLGGTILTSYLEMFGHKKIGRIVSVVGCLDGSDIAADMLERNFDTSDEFLRHRFLAEAFKEIKGDETGGYAANLYLNTLPRKAFNSLYTGIMSGIIDTVMKNCPQIWAMIPSTRYEALSARYLSGPESAVLKEKTDYFQKARLALRRNLLKAHDDGVKIDVISGSNLAFGEREYSFFGAIGSARLINGDGILSLNSTTLGATGAKPGETLPDEYLNNAKQSGVFEKGYISPDNKIDVSTAAFPDNTWIFLNQHHEVGNNHAVINLVKDIVLGKVSNVHSDPENHPQFNGNCHTKHLSRWRLPDSVRLIESDESVLETEDRNKLKELVDKAKALLDETIADGERADNLKNEIEEILARYGMFKKPEQPTAKKEKIKEILKSASEKTGIRSGK